MEKQFKTMIASAVAVVSLSAAVLTGIAVVNGFKENAYIDNTTADYFVTGLTIFGSFLAIIVLALVGKIIVGLFRGSQ